MWYYVRSNERFGPVDEDAIISLIQNGTVLRQTLVWKAGMQDWQRADACEFADKFPAVLLSSAGYGLATSVPSHTIYTAESFRTLWLWFTWLMCIGIPLSVISIGIPVVIAAVVLNYILLYRFWSLIQDGKARTSPGLAVGLCFVPILKIYWQYVAWVGLAKDMNLYSRDKEINAPHISINLALAWFIVSTIIIIPYMGVVIGSMVGFEKVILLIILLEILSVISVVLQIILLKQLVNASKEIIISKSKSSCEVSQSV